MKRHVLHTRAAIAAGVLPPRCTGRSTALALELVGSCLKYPGSLHHPVDHHSRTAEGYSVRHHSNGMLLRMCQDIVERLGLKGFVFNRAECTLKWEPYIDVEDDE